MVETQIMYLIYFSAIVAYTMASNAFDMRVTPETLGSAPHSSPIPSRPTTAPRFDLARRQGSLQNTCGWVNGNGAATCPPNSYCAIDPASSYVRCCGVDSLGSFTDCDDITSCTDYSQGRASCPTSCEVGVAYCNDIDYPYCWTDLIDLGSGSAFATWYPGCDTSSRLQILQLTSNPVTTTLSTSSTIASTVQLPPETVVTILPTTVVVTSISILSLPYPTSNSATDSRTSSFTTQSISSPTTSFTADSSTSSLTSQSISSSTTSSTVDSRTNSLTTGVAGISSGSTSSSSPNSSAQAASASASSTTGGVITSSEKSTNTGAIAGGTVGGVAVFAGIAGLVLFLLKKRRSSKPPIAETTEVNSMPHTAFVAPAPQEMHSPESSNRWSGGNSSEPQMSESAAGPRTSYPYYAPGQQTRPFPQQEISQVNYPDTRTFSRHFNIEMPG